MGGTETKPLSSRERMEAREEESMYSLSGSLPPLVLGSPFVCCWTTRQSSSKPGLGP